jgi:alkylation response protein AidB-like acyl-CoA dehydrogenase
MDLAFSPEDLAFQQEVRAWIASAYDDDLRRKMSQSKNGYLDKAGQVKWQKRLNEGLGRARLAGRVGRHGLHRLAALHLQHGAVAGRHAQPLADGLKMCAPVILAFGTPSRSASTCRRSCRPTSGGARAIPSPVRARTWPRLQMKAVRDGDDYVLNGSKIWTTHAQWADWMFCLVRTSTEGKPQNGITFLLLRDGHPGHPDQAAAHAGRSRRG